VTHDAEISGHATSPAGSAILTLQQRLPTSGARAVVPFELDGRLYLAIPQLAEDVPGQKPQMNAGNSDIDMIVYRWEGGQFHEAERLPVPGGEDAVSFHIGAERFLATASVRTGAGRTISTPHRRSTGAGTVPGSPSRTSRHSPRSNGTISASTGAIFWRSPRE